MIYRHVNTTVMRQLSMHDAAVQHKPRSQVSWTTPNKETPSPLMSHFASATCDDTNYRIIDIHACDLGILV